MTRGTSLLLGLTAATLAAAVAHAEDPRFRKALIEESSRSSCAAAHGQGFVPIQGTDTCIKIGGSVRVEYNYRR